MGVATTIALAVMLLAFISLVLDPFLVSITGNASAGGATSTTVAEERIRALLVGVSVILALLLALFTGGVVAGRFAPSHAGLNWGNDGNFYRRSTVRVAAGEHNVCFSRTDCDSR